MEKSFKTFDVQSVELPCNFQKAFDFLANPSNLPKWTAAFTEADEHSAVLVTPNGQLPIGLNTLADASTGTIDWHMTMPDGSIGKAYSRLTALPERHVVYSFVLLAPPVPLEELEGTLEMQKGLLAQELLNLEKLMA
ncbi:MAG: SRPBCC family protein [Bacteroidetes bacterium]|nr:SRPBCC family protein [Bacteroidota bacterium]